MHRRTITSFVLVAVMALGACSKSTAPEASPAAETTTAATDAAAPAGLTYEAHDFGFDGPDTIPAGTSDISFTNNGADDHEMIIIRLDKYQDWTEEQFVQYVKDDPDKQPKWAVPVGGVFPPIKGGESGTVQFMDFSGKQPVPVEGGSLEPGTYLLMCFVGNPPHAAMGMVKKVTVA